ncbi:Benzoyl-CoA reductase/2-hydroxyglutaryl-CoA dehydratase subunit, BcrC/BadD/HgdB [Sporobacter termitidis DSM 10068]|uniref:Benzoyl-CoA reductase/2-hydroxyglutaryl-CoA dehydratase subunit, BcrC/BadD/HgdB n=1 Tax=Sporobacter termitidis DSM 10068 TaxID=1123282 RepID=A0A1M5XD62_9FIRM|nr:2-hydroxyacyl-CoA dehydratase family protein [Sporobacter termitidis]SHH97716.1 Benzoyl-CoA reductase/2-hydroxyglutaryl-CoA dehydratase subunit, BcrC/BadD/HgdB [Sporobacter termitidis DSM 10068]
MSENIAWRNIMEHSRELHRYSPSLQKLFDLAEGYLTYAEDYAAQGGNVVFVMGLWQALIYACDAIPVPYTAIWTRDIHKMVEVAETQFQIPTETCSMIQASMGDWYMRRNGPIRKLFGMGSSCEPYNVALEILRGYGYDVYEMDSAYRSPKAGGPRYEHLLNFFEKQILGFQRFLTDGKPLDDGRLTFEILRRNRLIEKYQYILSMRLAHPFYVKSFGLMSLQDGMTSCFGRPDYFESVMDELIAEMEELPPEAGDLERVIPLVWGGGWGHNSGILEIIDASNAAILGIASAMSKKYRTDVPPIEALARYVLDGQNAGATIYQQASLENDLRRVDGKGIILYTFNGCSLETVSREIIKGYFQEKDIPCIILEGTFQPDLSIGQTQTRMRAFLEMLEQRKKDGVNGSISA